MKHELLKEEILSEEQLETVTGGTVIELKGLVDAILKNSYLKGTVNLDVNAETEVLRDDVKKILDGMGIYAYIPIGFNGFGTNAYPNEYQDNKTGEDLTHQQVLDRIKNYKG